MDKKSINDLLGNYNFVVPEIQREYVWGASKNKDVLCQFLHDLDRKLGRAGEANIGFLYSYESGSEHYLIDGQQRYTTILLLCHHLAVKEGGERHRQFVDRLKLDHNVPAFAYRVRSNTESFLKNLFTSGVAENRKVSDQTWFKVEYDNDTTIQSMIGALKVFDDEMEKRKHITLDAILNSVFFWYFDVKMTSQGEELYITMNSRGERLADSEQIKPRLLKKVQDEKEKHEYGKKWDEWEEFFYSKELRSKRDISVIDTAMNNVIRIVLELKTCQEHVHLNPVEDSESITIQEVKERMDALREIEQMGEGYKTEVERLYGDSKGDGDFLVLKALLTEWSKYGHSGEYQRVYETVRNSVRRNTLKNVAFLEFLKGYATSSRWYEYVLEKGKESDENKKVFDDHELEKVRICNDLGPDAENAIWTVQAQDFWKGEIKILIDWSKNNEVFCLDSFKRLTVCFNYLFDDKKENEGWTSDSVRQALIVRLPEANYPLDYYGLCFGYRSDQWKEIMKSNSPNFKDFLLEFVGKNSETRDAHLAEIKRSCPETHPWAEFVLYDYLLEYCDKKRVQRREQYGIECVQREYAKPYSVKNMRLKHYLDEHSQELFSLGWASSIDLREYKSVVRLDKNESHLHIEIQFREDKGARYEVTLRADDGHVVQDADMVVIQGLGFEYDDERKSWQALFPVDIPTLMDKLTRCFSISTTPKQSVV